MKPADLRAHGTYRSARTDVSNWVSKRSCVIPTRSFLCVFIEHRLTASIRQIRTLCFVLSFSREVFAPKIFMLQHSLHAPSTNDLKALKLQSVEYRMYCPLYMNCGSFQGRVCNHVASNTTVYQKHFLL